MPDAAPSVVAPQPQPLLDAPKITSGPLPAGTVGDPYSFQVTASGSPEAFTVNHLPDGLAIDPATGLISGTPTMAISMQVTVVVFDSSHKISDRQMSTLVIAPASTFTSGPPPDGVVGQPYSFQLTATGTPAGFASTRLIGTGLMLSPSGLLSGIPVSEGALVISFRVINSSGVTTDTQVDTLNIAAAPPLVFTSGAPPEGVVGQPYSFQLTASEADVTFAASLSLPDGLQLDTVTGLISGRPTRVESAPVTFVVTNNVDKRYGERIDVMFITAAPPTAPTLVLGPVPAATVGQPFDYVPTITSDSPTTITVVGQVPGLTIDSTTGELSGTPTKAGSFLLRYTVRNASDVSATGAITVTVNDATSTPPPTSPPPTSPPPTSPPTSPPPTTPPATTPPTTVPPTTGPGGGASGGGAGTGAVGVGGSGAPTSGGAASGRGSSTSSGSATSPRGTNGGSSNRIGSTNLAETGQQAQPLILMGVLALVLLVAGLTAVIVRRVRRSASRR